MMQTYTENMAANSCIIWYLFHVLRESHIVCLQVSEANRNILSQNISNKPQLFWGHAILDTSI